MIDKSIIGLVGPEFEVPIELGHLRTFAKSVGALLPEYIKEKQAIIPPTFLLMSAYFWGYLLERPGSTPLAGLNVRHSLDAGQSFTFYGPLPRVGETLIACTEVEDVWQKQGRNGGQLTFYKMLTRFCDPVSGTLRVAWRPVSVVVSQAPTEAAAQVDLGTKRPFYDRNEPREQLMVVPRQSWDELVVGEGQTAVAMPALTLTDVARYAFASGEDGAAHYDDAAARAASYPSWFSIGMYHAGLLATYAVQWLGPDNIRHFEARFNDMIWPGDVLTYSGLVANKRIENDERLIDLTLRCERAGKLVTSAKATFCLTEYS
ncbi:MAG: MaoC family dehydratase N-terminal domain-containing protein [Chloroflexota bacterium]